MFASAARPRWITDNDVDLRVVGLDREEVLLAKRLPVECWEYLAAFHELTDVRRRNLFEQRQVQRKHGDPDGGAVQIPTPQPGKKVEQIVPGDRPTGLSCAPVLAQTLEQANQENARAASRIQKAPVLTACEPQPIPDLCDDRVGEKHRSVVGTLGTAARSVFT